jgi:hypothetical protein
MSKIIYGLREKTSGVESFEGAGSKQCLNFQGAMYGTTEVVPSPNLGPTTSRC